MLAAPFVNATISGDTAHVVCQSPIRGCEESSSPAWLTACSMSDLTRGMVGGRVVCNGYETPSADAVLGVILVRQRVRD